MNWIQRLESTVLQSAYDNRLMGWKDLYREFNWGTYGSYWDLMWDLGLIDEVEYNEAIEWYDTYWNRKKW